MILFCLFIGKTPFDIDIDIAVYNQQLENTPINESMSLLFLQQIDTESIHQLRYEKLHTMFIIKILLQIKYDSNATAIESVTVRTIISSYRHQ